MGVPLGLPLGRGVEAVVVPGRQVEDTEDPLALRVPVRQGIKGEGLGYLGA